MIKQADLKQLVAAKAESAKLEQSEPVAAYLAAKAQERALLDALRARWKAGEEVQPGRLEVIVKRSAVVRWEAILKALRAIEEIACAIGGSKRAAAILKAAESRAAGEYVTERVEVSVGATGSG